MQGLLDIPLFFVQGCIGIWWLIQLLPWPAWQDYFGSFVLFVGLYPLRNYMEKRWLKRRFGRKKARRAPTPGQHQGAASVVGTILGR